MAEVKHRMTLSVTERNNLGNIRVRHADDETQVFEVESIIEDGIPRSFEGLTPFFCLMAREITGQGVSEEPVKVFDAKKGTLKYTLSPNAFQMIGRNEAYFSFRKELTNGGWTEQFSTRSFFYTVEKSVYSEPFKDSNYWWTFKELYTKFNDYIESGKKDWEDFVEQNKDIIEAVDPGGELLSRLGLFNRFREWDFSVIEKMENEFTEREFNVKWFGAKGGLVEDDTDAIQAAIDKAAENGGGIVLLPLESYRITHALRMKDNVVLKGQGSQMWETNAQRTKIVLDSTNINETAIDFRGKLLETNDYPDKIIYDLTKIKHTFGAALVDLHITNIPENRNSAGVMFNCCPTCFLQNVSIDGTFEVALVSAMSWFTSFKRVYAKGVFVGAFMQGMNASNIDMLLVGGRNQTEVANNMILNVAGKDKIDKSVGLFYRNSPGNTFNSLTAEFSYNGLLFYQSGSVSINAVYLENIVNKGLDIREQSQILINGGHMAAVKKFVSIIDRSSLTTSSLDTTDVTKYIDEIDNYSNMLIINEAFPKYFHKRLKYIGHFVNNVIVVDSLNGDDNNSGYMYNTDIAYPVKTLGRAIEIAENSELNNYVISLQSDNTYDIGTISNILTKSYKFIKKGTTINPVIVKKNDTSIGVSNAVITFEKGVDIKDSSTNASNTNFGIINVISGTNTINLLDTTLTISANTNGLIQGAYNANAFLCLNMSRCKISCDWLIARPASGLGNLTVVETSISSTISGKLINNGVPTGVKILASDIFNV